MASKGILVNLNMGNKLDGNDYEIWHHKFQDVLNEHDQGLEEPNPLIS